MGVIVSESGIEQILCGGCVKVGHGRLGGHVSKIYTRKHRNKSEFSRPKICIFIDNNERLPPMLHSGFSIDETAILSGTAR